MHFYAFIDFKKGSFALLAYLKLNKPLAKNTVAFDLSAVLLLWLHIITSYLIYSYFCHKRNAKRVQV